MEVIEHFKFQSDSLFEMVAFTISPGGVLFLTVPNQAAPLNKARLFAGKSITTPIDYFIEQMQPGNTKMHGVHWRENTLND